MGGCCCKPQFDEEVVVVIEVDAGVDEDMQTLGNRALQLTETQLVILVLRVFEEALIALEEVLVILEEVVMIFEDICLITMKQ